jgi:hypothetical protein
LDHYTQWIKLHGETVKFFVFKVCDIFCELLTSWNLLYVTGLCFILFVFAFLYGYLHVYGLCINSSRCSSTEEMYVSLSICFSNVGNFLIFPIIKIIILCSLQFQLYAVFISMVYLLDCMVVLVPCICWIVWLYWYRTSVDCIFVPWDIAAPFCCSLQQHGYCFVILSWGFGTFRPSS